MCSCSMKNVSFFIFENLYFDWCKNTFWCSHSIYTSNKNQITTRLKTSWFWNFFMIFVLSTRHSFYLLIYAIMESYLFFCFCIYCIAICWKKNFNHNFNSKFCVMMICIIAFNVLFVNQSLTLFCVVIKTVCKNINFLIDYFIFLIKVFENFFS